MKKIFIYFLFAVCAQQVQAQGSFVISYPISFPMGDLSDYISETSFRGISMEFNKRQKPNVDIGMEIGWNVFYQKESSKVYTDGTQSLAGVQYRYTNAVPMYVQGKFYKATHNPSMTPYFGLGIGTMYIDRSTDMGLYRIQTNTWQFALRPEIGFKWDTNKGTGILLGAKYHAGFGNSELDGQSFISVNIGFVFHGG